MYRVGPGIIQVGDNCYKHPFDMLSVIHKYTLSPEKNKCSYQNKIVDSEVNSYQIQNRARAQLYDFDTFGKTSKIVSQCFF